MVLPSPRIDSASLNEPAHVLMPSSIVAMSSEVAAAPLEAHTSASHGHAEEAAEGADEYLKLVEADVAHSEKH